RQAPIVIELRDDSVESRIQPRDAIEMGGHRLARGELAGPNAARQIPRAREADLVQRYLISKIVADEMTPTCSSLWTVPAGTNAACGVPSTTQTVTASRSCRCRGPSCPNPQPYVQTLTRGLSISCRPPMSRNDAAMSDAGATAPVAPSSFSSTNTARSGDSLMPSSMCVRPFWRNVISPALFVTFHFAPSTSVMTRSPDA